ncbi:SET domain-containing protein [Ahniella affigens]|nr:SET domain-containing protein-lysine N-methyltransferase [Ahniella affigens]
MRLMLYQGERISSDEAVGRYGDNTSLGSTYLFAVNEDWLIDGQVGGNSARFINHSCEPNCEAVIWVDINGDSRKDKVWIETLREIETGEELTIDYALELASAAVHPDLKAWQCRCGQPNCRGSMLASG